MQQAFIEWPRGTDYCVWGRVFVGRHRNSMIIFYSYRTSQSSTQMIVVVARRRKL